MIIFEKGQYKRIDKTKLIDVLSLKQYRDLEFVDIGAGDEEVARYDYGNLQWNTNNKERYEEIERIASEYNTTVTEDEVGHILWGHTGFPEFWRIGVDGDTPEECFQKQVRAYFEGNFSGTICCDPDILEKMRKANW